MKKIMAVIIVVSAILFSCSNPASNTPATLIGDWGVSGVKAMTFTSDGVMKNYSGAVTITYGYSASNGAGEYWVPSFPTEKVPFTYTVTSTTLDYSIPSISISLHLTRM